MGDPPEEVLIPADGFNTNNWSVRYPALGRQRQRIGLVRALYRRPSLLILDEATSALDIATETKLFEALRAALWEVCSCTSLACARARRRDTKCESEGYWGSAPVRG